MEPPRPLNSRIRDTLLAPTRLFQGFGERPPWIDALAVATLLAAVAIVAEPAEFYLSQMEDPVNRRGAPVEITSSPQQIVLYGRMMASLSALAGHPVLAFLVAGLLTLVFSVIGRGQTSFRQYLAMVSHALIITGVGMLIAVLLRIVTGNADSLPTIGGLVPGLSDASVVGRILGGFNFFTLWMLAVLAIGVATAESRFTRARTTAILWGGYAVLVVTTAIVFRA